MPSVITPKQRDRLLNRSEQESNEERRLNDFYVRKAIKRWLGSIQDMLLALNALPERQISELFKEGINDEDVFALLEIIERSLAALDFMPIQRTEDGTLATIKGLYAHRNIAGGQTSKPFILSREATDLDKSRHSALHTHLSRLGTFYPQMDSSAVKHAIYNDIDAIYYKDLIATAKKEGYEPTEISERTQWIPRLTPTQYQFEEDRKVLDMLGFRGIEYPADLKILEEALRSEEGKALMEKFRSMQEQPPK